MVIPVYLLDTNVLAEPLRPVPNAGVLAHLRQYDGAIAIPAIVWHEMWFGSYRLPASARRQAIESYLTQVIGPNVPILAYDSPAAAWHAAERARLSGIGLTPPFADGMIAAIAKTQNLTLVTRNFADFHSFQGLRLESWHDHDDG